MALDLLLDLVYPSRCAACQATVRPGHDWCSSCASTLISGFEHVCTRCGRIWLDGQIDHVCGACTLEPPSYRMTRATFAYGGALQDVIGRWKNIPDEPLGRALAELGATALAGTAFMRIADTPGPVVLTSVPSRKHALIRRGFNPAAILARRWARTLGLPYLPHALGWTIEGVGAKGLKRRERLERVRGHMRANPKRLRGATVCIVDDVITTGATMTEAARACVAAGAGDVIGLALARVPES